MSVGLAAPAGATTVSSTFDSSNQGWSVGDIGPSVPPPGIVGAAGWNASGGNPGGYISTTDVANIVAFLASSSYTGNLSAFHGGTLTFDLQDLDGNDSVDYPAVVIYTSTGSIAYDAPPPGTTWTSYSVPLTASGWTEYLGGENTGGTPLTEAQFVTALSNVTALAIEADWHNGADLTGLDNVILSTGASGAAPEPSTWAMMIIGLSGLGLVSRRRLSRATA